MTATFTDHGQQFAALAASSWRASPDMLAAHLNPKGFQRFRHARLLGAEFRRWVNGIEPFQIWTTQPQIGKSTLGARWGPVWLFDQRPDAQVIVDTFSAQLSGRHGKAVRDLSRVHARNLRYRIDPSSSARHDWSTTDGGHFLGVGVDGTITGNPGGFIIMDDPHKGWRQAQSVVQRQAVWDHYRGDVLGRLQDEARVLIIMTRWHEDDLVGRIQDDGSIPYHVVHLPAIADSGITPDGDPLGREDGEVVDPRRFRKSTMLKRKQAAGSFIWNASYQGTPTVPQGDILLPNWVRFRPVAPRRNDILLWCTSWDLSFTGGPDSSYVVGQLWAMTNDRPHRFILWDQVRAQLNYPDTRKTFTAWARQHPWVAVHLVEKKANGDALIADVAGDVQGVVGIDPSWAPGGGEKRDKEGRKIGGRKIAAAQLVSPLLEQGRVELPGWLPEGTPWIQDVLRELGEFPNGDNDDQVDAMTQALHWLDVRAQSHYGRRATVIDERLFGRR